ncbi:DMT family transporter [Aeromicrobium sp.]|uniref:DMT family transporter n=1 Tax=Aeromicrobium sp. TaxID=1871063 RepID=UPI003D6B37F3
MSIGIALALVAAIGYGSADFVGGVGARRAPTMSIVFVGQLAGAAAMLLVGAGSPSSPTSSDFGWAVLAGLGGGIGSIFLFRGLSRGRMGVVAPTSAVGAVALPVLAGLAAGERPAPLVWTGLAIALPGIWLVSRQPSAVQDSGHGTGRGALVDGLLAGVGFGVLFVALGQIPESAGTLPLAVNQLTGAVLTLAVASVLRQRWQPSARAVGWGIASGILGVTASLAFVQASQLADLGIVAVLTSLYPAVTVLLARAVLNERIHAAQRVGLICCTIAVAMVAAP